MQSTDRNEETLSRALASVAAKLALLQEANLRKVPHWDRPGNCARLFDPIAVSEVRSFEKKHGVVLPEDYVAFITRLGNGGTGPPYGLLPLRDFCPGNGASTLSQQFRSEPSMLDSPAEEHDDDHPGVTDVPQDAAVSTSHAAASDSLAGRGASLSLEDGEADCAAKRFLAMTEILGSACEMEDDDIGTVHFGSFGPQGVRKSETKRGRPETTFVSSDSSAEEEDDDREEEEDDDRDEDEDDDDGEDEDDNDREEDDDDNDREEDDDDDGDSSSVNKHSQDCLGGSAGSSLQAHPGALVLCHEGCGYFALLAVSGPERGKMYMDARCTDGGIVLIADSFLAWYDAWLDECLARITPA